MLRNRTHPDVSRRLADYPRPSVTVDLAVLTVRDADLKVLLIKRGEAPFFGNWVLPGGFVQVDSVETRQGGESLDAAAERVLREKTTLARGKSFLEQLQTFGAPRRDPRWRIISVAYYALIPPDLAPSVTASANASDADWFSVANLAAEGIDRLGFDHDQILKVALRRIRERLDDLAFARSLVPSTFTVAELRSVHEAVRGQVDAANFRRRFRRMCDDGLIEQAPGKRHTASKPARVFRFTKTPTNHSFPSNSEL